MAFSKKEILRLLSELSNRLDKAGVIGELHIVGGAVMCLVYEARSSTKDIDGFFHPTKSIREAVASIAQEEDLQQDWLNDAVKGFLSDKGEYSPYGEFKGLRVYVPFPEYLLAMKCLAMRLGPEFSDEEDVRYLIRYLNLSTYDEVITIVTKYYPIERFPQKSFFALEELMEKRQPQSG